MGSYRDLAVYQEGRKLYRLVYDALAELPLEEKYAMASQMRRASISITSNIAEGQGRGTIRDYIHFLYNSRGSAYELESQIISCSDLSLMKTETLQKLYTKNKLVIQLLNRLIDTLQEKSMPKGIHEDVVTYGKCDGLLEPFDREIHT